MAEEQLDPRASDAGAGADGDLAGVRVNGPENTLASATSKYKKEAARIASLFPTYTKSFAWFDPETLSEDNKGKIVPKRQKTEHRAPAPADWERHVAGKRAIGVVPAADDEGLTTSWGGGDVDVYGIDIAELAANAERLELPVVIYRTKSDGARYVISATAPVPVALMRSAVAAIGRQLGLDPDKLEVFPMHKDRIRPEKVGKVLWMPYCGGRFAGVKRTGAEMTIGEFAAAVEDRRLPPEKLAALAASPPPVSTPRQTPEDEGARYAAHKLARFVAALAATTSNRNETLNNYAFQLGTMVARGWLAQGDVERALFEACTNNGLLAEELSKTRDTLTRAIADGLRQPHADLIPILSKADHRGRARQFRAEDRSNLRRWRGDFLDWDRARYRIVSDETIEAEVGAFLDNSMVRDDEGKLRPFFPGRAAVGETIFALEGISHLRPETTLPAWLDGRSEPPPADLIGFPNGLLNWRTGELLAPTSALFSQQACGFEYDPNPPPPDRFLSFLDEVFDREADQIDALQEIFGYCLSPDISHQKMFLIVGPKRSGKGTIASVLRSLLAEGAVCGPTIASFAGNFGLQPLIGRQLAIVDDLRIGRRTDKALLAERLLTISGGGELTIDRKNREAWTGPLAIKFLIISNEVPAFADDSGALASRFISLSTRISFYDREDRHLIDALLAEKAGIFRWALDGLRRLEDRGRFDEPGGSKEIRGRLAAAASPVQAFVEECCVFDPSAMVKKDDLFEEYVRWAKASSQPISDKNIFAEALISASDGGVRPSKPRVGGRQVPHFVGIRFVYNDRADTIL